MLPKRINKCMTRACLSTTPEWETERPTMTRAEWEHRLWISAFWRLRQVDLGSSRPGVLHSEFRDSQDCTLPQKGTDHDYKANPRDAKTTGSSLWGYLDLYSEILCQIYKLQTTTYVFIYNISLCKHINNAPKSLLATKPDHLRLILGNCMIEEENWIPETGLWLLHGHHGTCAYTHSLNGILQRSFLLG